MAANLVEKLQEAIKECEEISAKDFKTQKEEIAKQFGELQKAVYEIIDEKGIILSNSRWIRKKMYTSASFDKVLDAEAEKISMYTGYSEETIREMLLVKNNLNWSRKGYFEIEFSTLRF